MPGGRVPVRKSAAVAEKQPDSPEVGLRLGGRGDLVDGSIRASPEMVG